MHSPNIFCPNMDCPARGQVGQGNIGSHGKSRPRFYCSVCGKTFSARAGTPFFRRRTDEATITCVVTLVGNGCPIAAIQAAFGFQAQTVREWVEAAAEHSLNASITLWSLCRASCSRCRLTRYA